MTEQLSGSGRPGQLSTSRLEAFSDGVFAIAITLLFLAISHDARLLHVPLDRARVRSTLRRAACSTWRPSACPS